jgi:hypothetical protein
VQHKRRAVTDLLFKITIHRLKTRIRYSRREGKKTLPFCRKLMAKAEGFTSRLIFPSMWRFCVRWVSVTGCHHCCAGVQLTLFWAMFPL